MVYIDLSTVWTAMFSAYIMENNNLYDIKAVSSIVQPSHIQCMLGFGQITACTHRAVCREGCLQAIWQRPFLDMIKYAATTSCKV